MSDFISEWYRCAPFSPHAVTRRQIVEVPGGYQLTPVELVGTGPACLRDYEGGWHFPTKTQKTLVDAERYLTDNGFTREMPAPGTPPTLRKRSGPGGSSSVPQRAVRMPDDLWERLGRLAEERGTDRNKLVNAIVEDYLARATT